MPTPTLLTYGDMIDELVHFLDGLPEEASQDRARQAIQAAYRELPLSHKWRYFTAHGRINVTAEYTTGTVTYTSSTRTLTLASGTWPDWARSGRLLIGSDTVIYKVAERSSDSEITLEADFCPAADVAAGTSYTLYRAVYPLPADMRGLEEIHDEATLWSTTYINPGEWVAQERHFRRSGRPFCWTVMGAADLYGQMALHLNGRPATAQTFDFIYQRNARAMNYDGYGLFSSQESNSVTSAAAAQDVFELSEIVLPTDVVGSVVRMGRTDTSIEDPPKNLGSVNPYSEQKIIIARPDGRRGQVDSNFSFGEGTDGHFTISDPVDLPNYLLEAFQRGCEYQLALRQAPDRVALQQNLYQAALQEARARNAYVQPPRSPVGWNGWKHPAWTMLYGTMATV